MPETEGDHQVHRLTFSIGCGNHICVAAIDVWLSVWNLIARADMGRFWRHVTGDNQLRWIGSDKGDPP